MKTITVQELHDRIEMGESLNLIDVREPYEHEDFNIGGILIPLGDIRIGETESIEHLKNQEILCYCRSGNRSGQAAMVLESMGFTNIINVSGGMLAWQDIFPSK